MLTMKPRFLALPAAILMALSGCESLGPESIKRTPIPSNLSIESVKGLKEIPPIQSEPLTARKVRPPEYYPATGNLLGRKGTTLAGTSSQQSRKEGKYTLNFDDADLSEVAKTILDETLKVNYIINPKVSGKVTLQTTRALTDDELIPTLEMLLRVNGAVLIKDNGTYRIEPEAAGVTSAPGAQLGVPGQRMPPGYQVRVAPLRYVGAQEMQKVLEPLMPPKSIVRVDNVRNMLMLAGTADELQSALDTIQMFDVDFMRGMSVGLYPLANVEAGLIAEELEKVMGDTNKGPLAGLVRILPIERLSAILAVTSQPRYLEEISAWIGRLDRYNSTRTGGVHVYRVQNVDAVELAKTLSNIFGGGMGGGGKPSLRPGSQGSQIGGAYASANSVTSTAGDQGSSTAGDLGMGASNGGLETGGRPGTGAGSSYSGMGGSMSGGGGAFGGGSGGGMSGGMSGGSGGSMGGGIGRGSSSNRSKGSTTADLGNVRIVADPSNNALIITAKAQDYQEIASVIKELDTMPYQVLIDATIAEVALGDALKYGVKWYFQQGSNAESLNGVPDVSVLKNAASSIAGATPYAFQYSLVMAGKDIRLLLSAEASKGKVNVLSSPSVMVLNNQEAAIKVGDQVPILTGQYGNFSGSGASTANNPVYSSYNSVQYRDTGVLLNVRPRVNAGGLVSMDIIQAVDDVKSDTSGKIDSPTITQRQIKSSVAVHSGDTLVLGGLIKEKVGITKSGVPLLYELPVIGDLFGKTDMAAERTELVVLLTPRVVENRVRGREITNEFRRKLTGLYEDTPSSEEGGHTMAP